jgi:L-malate glycosyltransferase
LNLSDYPYRMRKRVRPRILWMRAFHENYNPEMAIRVLARLEELVPDAELVMAGQDKGLLPKMRKLAQELGIGKRIFFPGVMDKDAKQLESNKSDIFINTSRIDNAPVSILEAFAFGMPVVSTNVGGISVFLKDRENAILVDSNSIEDMVQAILEIIRDPQIASHLSQNGRILAEASDWNRLEKSWSNILNSL